MKLSSSSLWLGLDGSEKGAMETADISSSTSCFLFKKLIDMVSIFFSVPTHGQNT